MTFDEALRYSQEYGKRAKRLSRMSKASLLILDAQLMTEHGQSRLFGKLSKDELINEILGWEFPDILEADFVRAEHARELHP